MGDNFKNVEGIYNAPKSDLKIDENQFVVDDLGREESYILSIFSAVMATVLGIFLLANIPGRAPLFVYLLPALFSGIAVKYIGRPISILCRVICGIVTGAIAFAVLAFNGVTFSSIAIGFLSILVCLALNRRNLTYEQEKALYRIRHNIKGGK